MASTQEPPASITTGAVGHCQRNDTLQSRDLQHQSLASEEEPLDYGEGEQLSPTGAGEGLCGNEWGMNAFQRLTSGSAYKSLPFEQVTPICYFCV